GTNSLAPRTRRTGDREQPAAVLEFHRAGIGAGHRRKLFFHLPRLTIRARARPHAPRPASAEEAQHTSVGLRVAEPTQRGIESHVRLARETEAILAGSVVTDAFARRLARIALPRAEAVPVVRREEMEYAFEQHHRAVNHGPVLHTKPHAR